MKIQTLIILSLIFVMSCKCNKTNTSKMANVNIESVLIAKGNLYGSGEEGFTKQNLVVTNQSEWKGLWMQMNQVNNVSNSFSETEIDFSKYDVIAVFNAVQGSGGHKIDLDISTTPENRIVNVKHSAPTGNASSVMTQPYYIVKVLKSDLPIVFQ